MTVYRIDPKVNNKLVDPDARKDIAIVPAGEFTKEWLGARHGWGLYDVYFNDASDKSGYMAGKVDLRNDLKLEEAMFTKDGCKIDLRTVLPISKNEGYIQSWTVAGMWPPTGKDEDDMAVAITPELLTALRGEGGGSSSDKLLLPILLKLLDRDAKPAAGAITKEEMLAYGQQIAENTAAKIRAEQQDAKIKELEARLLAAEQTAANPAAASGGGLAVVERKALQALTKKLLAQIDGGDDDDDESWVGLIKKHAPDLLKSLLPALQQRFAAPAAAPNPGGQVIPMPPPAGAEDDEADGETELDMIAELLTQFLRGVDPIASASWLTAIAAQQPLYDRLQEQGADTLIANLENPLTAQVLEDAPQVLARRADFRTWLEEFLAFDVAEEPPAAPEAPAALESPAPPQEKQGRRRAAK